MELIINNPEKVRINLKRLKRISGKASRKNWIVSLSFVSKSEMKKLNKKYRRMDKPTDVLSFNMNEGRMLGDIMICPSEARKNAKEYGSSFSAEIERLFAHGLLHLLGFDHGRKMFDRQDRILGGASNA